MAAIVISTVIGIAALFSGECHSFGPSSTAPAVVWRRGGGGRRTPPPLLAATTSGVDDDDDNDKDDDAGAVLGRGGDEGGVSSIEETVAEKLRRRASVLRAEARAAEMVLRGGGGASATATATRPPPSSSSSSAAARGRTEREKRARYTELGGSCWEMTYRFANEPESAEEDDDAGKKRPERRTYGGKVRIRFRRDGYSDILTPVVVVDDDVIIDHRVATFEKVWGWDLEAASSSSSGGSSVESKGGENDPSSPESSDFLLFSADVRLPPPISAVEKFYFQASVVSPADKRGGGTAEDYR